MGNTVISKDKKDHGRVGSLWWAITGFQNWKGGQQPCLKGLAGEVKFMAAKPSYFLSHSLCWHIFFEIYHYIRKSVSVV